MLITMEYVYTNRPTAKKEETRKGKIRSKEEGEEDEEQSFKQALRQPQIWSFNDFIFWPGPHTMISSFPQRTMLGVCD